MSTFRVLHGDCAELLRALPDASVHAVVTDPPAGIGFMGREWDSDKGGRDAWIAWLQGIAAECLRVIKPGGHALVWALPRTSHWTATAWENAGWEVRDRLVHLFGVGFPKSLNVSKAIDAAAGAKREAVGKLARPASASSMEQARAMGGGWTAAPDVTAPATPEAAAWDGWGTALKPGAEDWWLFRRPLGGTVAANVLRHGTGALNIAGCRIQAPAGDREDYSLDGSEPSYRNLTAYGQHEAPRAAYQRPDAGRWPANVIHDGSDEVLDAFAEYGESVDGAPGSRGGGGHVGPTDLKKMGPGVSYGGSGTPARFFYCTKATASDREDGCYDLPVQRGGALTGREEDSDGLKSPRAGAGRGGGRANMHPTVKPTALMRWLCRLITPPGGTVLDPFTGSGSTGRGAAIEGFDFIGMELDAQHVEVARRRILSVGPLLVSEAT